MERKVLKNAVIAHCKKLQHRSHGGRKVDLIISPSEKVWKQLENGSGNAKEEVLYADSSTALGVNYFSLFADTHQSCEIEYEWKKDSPLKIGGNSNLDIMVKEGDIIKFYESKFLEPYYMANSKFTDSYRDCDNYKIDQEKAKNFIEYLDKVESNFNYFNVSQLLRHLLAIVNHICANPSEYEKVKEVHLISICWEMPDDFIKDIEQITSKRSISYLRKRRETLAKEKEESQQIINEIIEKLFQPIINNVSPVRLSYRTDSYNNVIKDIEKSKYINTFKEQYYL